MSAEKLDMNRERRLDRAALPIAAFLLVLGAIVAWDASRLGGAAQYARIGPQTVPYVVAACLAGLGIWTIIEAFRGDFPEREHQEAWPVLWIVAGLLIQLLTIRWIGFSIATGAMFALVARGFDERRFWISLPAGIILSTIVWFIFARGLALTLPHGPLEDALTNLLNAMSPGRTGAA